MGDVILLRKLDETPGGFVKFVGGPHDGTERLMGAGMQVIAVPGTCPAQKVIHNHDRWCEVNECVYEDGEELTYQPSTHLMLCACPDEWRGMQEYRVRGGEAHYVGRRPNPEQEDDQPEGFQIFGPDGRPIFVKNDESNWQDPEADPDDEALLAD